MTKRSPWSSVIVEGTSPGARRTWNTIEWPKLIMTKSLGLFCWPNKDSFSLCQRVHDLGTAYRFKFTPVGTFLLAHQGDKRGATLLHKPITSPQTASLVCGLTAAPRPYWRGDRQSCLARNPGGLEKSPKPPSHPKVEAYELWRYPLAPKSSIVLFHTPSSSSSIA